MTNQSKFGKVILAGAGPGDPELITLKALRYLQQADVIITDRLVSSELITQYARPDAEVIYVGKQAGQVSSTPQEEINALLVEQAAAHTLVVRLKGGDVMFFANVLDELRTLVHHGIPFEIVPGVTAASGAAAWAGIPLTARGYASAVRFLTINQNTILEDAEWSELATTDDTLVFYMSADRLDFIVANLLDHRIKDDKGMAVIEQATTPVQNVHLFNLETYRKKTGRKFVSPTLIIIGRVTSLHNQFRWKPAYSAGESYFTPLDQLLDQPLIRR